MFSLIEVSRCRMFSARRLKAPAISGALPLRVRLAHGVDSALLAVTIVNVVRSASLPSVDFRRPSQVLAALNNAFPMEQFGEKMFTIWYGVFNTATRVLRWSGAGHPPALLFSAGARSPCFLDSFGSMAGMIDGADFEEQECTIEQYARLIIYSDGAQEGGLQRRIGHMHGCCRQFVEAICTQLFGEAEQPKAGPKCESPSRDPQSRVFACPADRADADGGKTIGAWRLNA